MGSMDSAKGEFYVLYVGKKYDDYRKELFYTVITELNEFTRSRAVHISSEW